MKRHEMTNVSPRHVGRTLPDAADCKVGRKSWIGQDNSACIAIFAIDRTHHAIQRAHVLSVMRKIAAKTRCAARNETKKQARDFHKGFINEHSSTSVYETEVEGAFT